MDAQVAVVRTEFGQHRPLLVAGGPRLDPALADLVASYLVPALTRRNPG